MAIAESEQSEKPDEYYKNLAIYLYKHAIHVFDSFKADVPLESHQFGLDGRLVTVAMTNATSDLRRSVEYHSESGPTDIKIAAFAGRWIAHQRPVWVDPKRPIMVFDPERPPNLNSDALDSINAIFAVGTVRSLAGVHVYPKLARDLCYCFEYRRMTGDDIALLLEHALKWSRLAENVAGSTRYSLPMEQLEAR